MHLFFLTCYLLWRGKRDRDIQTLDRDADWLPPACPMLGIQLATLACVHIWNLTRHLLFFSGSSTAEPHQRGITVHVLLSFMVDGFHLSNTKYQLKIKAYIFVYLEVVVQAFSLLDI